MGKVDGKREPYDIGFLGWGTGAAPVSWNEREPERQKEETQDDAAGGDFLPTLHHQVSGQIATI